MGERTPYWDPHLRGDFVGIGAHHQAKHFARAILEGVAFSVRDCLQAIEALGQPITEMRLLGGGARSSLWRQIICDVLGQPLVRPGVEGAAYGAALLAGVAVGVFSDWQAAIANGVQVNEVLQPNAEAHELYNGYFEVYQEVTRDLVHHSHRLAALAQRTR
jgi:xylulokinase